MVSVTINGNTYSADGSAAKDMQHDGHRTHLIPMMQDVVVETSNASTDAANAATSASQAQTYAAALSATSSSSISFGTGSKVFTVGTGKQFAAQQWVKITRTSTSDYMWGPVTSYTSGDLTVDVQVSSPSSGGPYTTWTIGMAGPQGAAGSSTPDSVLATKSANYTAVAADKGDVIEFDTGSTTLNLTAAATLGSGWWCKLINSSTGDVTVDPNSTELINGSSTITATHGESYLILCDGSAFDAFLIDRDVGTQRVAVHTGNGYGSTKTKFRRFTTTLHNDGTDITYADSSANGASFTINETGLYYIRYNDDDQSFMAVTRNQAGTATPEGTTPSDMFIINTNTANGPVSTTAVAFLDATDVINAHSTADSTDTSNTVYFEVIRIL